METNIWLKECSTVTMMSPSLVLRAVKMLYCIFTVSYHHLVRHILRSSLKHLFLSNRNLKAKVFAAVEQTKCFIILCISLTGLQQLHNVPFSVRAQILPLKYWSTSFFYSASLETLGKMRSVNTKGKPAHILTYYSHIHSYSGEIKLLSSCISLNFTSLACVFSLVHRILSTSLCCPKR